jgi:hypothetical protein
MGLCRGGLETPGRTTQHRRIGTHVNERGIVVEHSNLVLGMGDATPRLEVVAIIWLLAHSREWMTITYRLSNVPWTQGPPQGQMEELCWVGSEPGKAVNIP